MKVEDQAWWHGRLGTHLSVSESEWKRIWLQYWGNGPLSLCPACLPHAPATQPEPQPSCSPGYHAGGLAASFYDHSTLTPMITTLPLHAMDLCTPVLLAPTHLDTHMYCLAYCVCPLGLTHDAMCIPHCTLTKPHAHRICNTLT